MEQVIEMELLERFKVLEQFRESCLTEISQMAESLISTFSQDKKLLVCGNGGSAADSQHLVAEFLSSFSSGLKRRPLPAISLTVDTSVITAIANDFGYEHVFSRQIKGLGNLGDAVLLISTSGQSKNCLDALDASRGRGMKVLALTRKGSELYTRADIAVGVPSENTQLIQECHIATYHIIAGLVDQAFLEH
jgi:D-sedoheptulose 7-phosphate isomerase